MRKFLVKSCYLSLKNMGMSLKLLCRSKNIKLWFQKLCNLLASIRSMFSRLRRSCCLSNLLIICLRQWRAQERKNLTRVENTWRVKRLTEIQANVKKLALGIINPVVRFLLSNQFILVPENQRNNQK